MLDGAGGPADGVWKGSGGGGWGEHHGVEGGSGEPFPSPLLSPLLSPPSPPPRQEKEEASRLDPVVEEVEATDLELTMQLLPAIVKRNLLHSSK